MHLTVEERDLLFDFVVPPGALDDVFSAARVTGQLVCFGLAHAELEEFVYHLEQAACNAQNEVAQERLGQAQARIDAGFEGTVDPGWHFVHETLKTLQRKGYISRQPGEASTPDVAVVEAVEAVGNPTILATFTVIAAILPMAFGSGMMGPYLRPIPVGASVAMLASLGVAFIVTPYLAYLLLKGHVQPAPRPHDRAHEEEESSGFARFYARSMTPLMDRRARRLGFYGAAGAMLLVSMALVVVKAVQVKMLSFDNKSEFQVVLDLPEGTTLETSNALGQEVAAYLRRVPEVKSTEVYGHRHPAEALLALPIAAAAGPQPLVRSVRELAGTTESSGVRKGP